MDARFPSTKLSATKPQSSGSPSFGGIYLNEYRSALTRDYKKTVTARGSTIVHTESARGFNSADPHPPYSGSYGRNRSCYEQRSYGAAQKDAAKLSTEVKIDNNVDENVTLLPNPPFPQISSIGRNAALPSTLVTSVRRSHESLPQAQETQEDGVPNCTFATPSSSPSTSFVIPDPPEKRSCIDSAHLHGSICETMGPQSRGSLCDLPQALAPNHSGDHHSRNSPFPLRIAEENANSLPTDSFIRHNFSTFQSAYLHGSESRSHFADLRPLSESQSQTSSEAISTVFAVESHGYREDFMTPFQSVESLPSNPDSESSFGAGGDTGSIFTSASTAQTQSDTSEALPPDLTYILPCEFIGYAHCDLYFHPADKDQWINHVMVDHLNYNLPSKCCCWFCDNYVFDPELSGVDITTNFVQRMEHIREHFVQDGFGVKDIRPDYHFVNHLWQTGLIHQRVLEEAKAWREGPVSGVTGIYAHDFEPWQCHFEREDSGWVMIDQQKEDRQRRKKNRRVGRRILHTEDIRPQPLEAESDQKNPRTPRATKIHHGAQSRRCAEPERTSLTHSPTSASNSSIKSCSSTSSDTSEEPSVSIQRLKDTPKSQDLICLEERFSKLRFSGELSTGNFSAAQEKGSMKVHDITNEPCSIVRSLGQQPELASNIQLAVQRLVDSIHSRAQARYATYQEHTNNSTHKPCSTPTSSRPERDSKQTYTPFRYSGIDKKKRKLSHDHHDENEGSDEERAPAAISKGKQKENHPPFACPYFKNNRSQYGNRRFCNGPGWPDMHRLKEHLFRKHKQALYCGRCWTTFKEQNAFDDHQRGISRCPILPKVRMEGMDDDQERQLKSRKTFSKMEECAKWRKAYNIIFPDVSEDNIPTPYYEEEDFHYYRENENLEQHKIRLKKEWSHQIVNGLVEGLRAMCMVDPTELYQHCTIVVDKAFEAISPTADGASPASEALVPTTGDSRQQSIQQAKPPTSSSIPDIETSGSADDFATSSWWAEYINHPEGDPVLVSVSSTFPEPRDPTMEHSEEDLGFQQYLGSDSGYHSNPGHDCHPRRCG